MSSTTTNFGLRKIDLTDAPPDITVLNQNWDAIDRELKEHGDELENLQNALDNVGDGDYLPLDGSESMTGTLKFNAEKGVVGNKSEDGVTETYISAVDGDESHLLTVSNYGVHYFQGTKTDPWQTSNTLYGTHNITSGTTDLTAGTSSLATGCIHLVYE